MGALYIPHDSKLMKINQMFYILIENTKVIQAQTLKHLIIYTLVIIKIMKIRGKQNSSDYSRFNLQNYQEFMGFSESQ